MQALHLQCASDYCTSRALLRGMKVGHGTVLFNRYHWTGRVWPCRLLLTHCSERASDDKLQKGYEAVTGHLTKGKKELFE